MLACSFASVAFTPGTPDVAVRLAQASRPAANMMADAAKNPFGVGKKLPPVPKGPFGGFRLPGEDTDGIVGDRSQGTQIAKFQAGEDYLFFQGPAPKTAIQDDLPSLFSAENFEDLEIVPAQIAVTATGLLSFAVVLGTLLGDDGLPLPALPSVSVSLPTPSKPVTLDEAALAAEAAAKAEKAAAKKAEAEAKAAEKAEKAAAQEARAAEKAAAKALKAEVAAAKKGEAEEAKAAAAAAKAEQIAEEKEAAEKNAAAAEAKAAEVEVREEKAAEEKEKIAEKLEMQVIKEKAAAAKAARSK